MNEQVVSTSNTRDSTPNSAVIKHRKVIKALYKALMWAFRTKWHALVLARYLYCTALDSCGRNTTHYLFRALVEQHALCLPWASCP